MPAPMLVHAAPPVAEGGIVRVTLYAPWPVEWVGRYENVRDDGFDDVMVEGPFASWRHEHRWRALDGDVDRTEVVDRITAEPMSLASRAIWAGVPAAFAYRAWATRRACESEERRDERT